MRLKSGIAMPFRRNMAVSARSGRADERDPAPARSATASFAGEFKHPASLEDAESGVYPTGARAGRESEPRARVLVVDGDPVALRGMGRLLGEKGYDVTEANGGEEAARLIDHGCFDVVLSDVAIADMSAAELCREIRQRDLTVPIVFLAPSPRVASAVQALELGASYCLVHPFADEELARVVDRAVCTHRMALISQQAAVLLGHTSALRADRAGLEVSFERAIELLWMAYQPIVSAVDGSVYGYEALLRSHEPALPDAATLIDGAERLGRVDDLGRTARNRAAGPFAERLAERSGAESLFINLHVNDLLDRDLYRPNTALSKIADRVVLELTARSALNQVKSIQKRVAELKELGFRIAVDDIGAGSAALATFALLEPEVIKLDPSLVRDVNHNGTKQNLVRSLTKRAGDMAIIVVAEGVETVGERDALTYLGCDLLQGFLFARPGPPFPEARR
jgi:EAL domain-containing protein (putative c-di-GMP-specific phosphodiesterase class I)